MNKYRNYSALLILLSIGFYSKILFAQFRHEYHFDRGEMIQASRYRLAQSQNVISPEQAKRMAEDRFGWKALSAKLERHDNNNPVYRVKMIDRGHVKTVTVPANP